MPIVSQQVKTFSILVSFSLRYSYFSESPWGYYTPGESISPGYHTPASHLTFLDPIKRECPTKFSNCFLHNSRLPIDFGDDFANLFEFFVKVSPGSQLSILKLFAQAFKGTVSQK